MKMSRALVVSFLCAAALAPVKGWAQQQVEPITNLTPPAVQPMAATVRACDPSSPSCPNVITHVGLGKGDALVRVRMLGVIPENTSSGTSIGGHVKTTNFAMPEVDLSYFFTDNLAIEGIASSTRHEIRAAGTAAGDVNVGSTWVLPPTITLQWHFRPHEKFNPYIGVGGTVAFFYAQHPAGGIVNKLNLHTAVGPAVNVGFDYQLSQNWFLNFDAKQIFLRTHADLNERGGGAGPWVKARTWLDPTLVSAGIGYRF